MSYFLEHIASSLYKEFGNKLNRHCLVFPNRRAGLYFMKYLASAIDKPVWVPSVVTINELFRRFSTLQLAGNEILLSELYKVFKNLKKPAENFDDFYYWGDMLLDDFDDVDKYLVNPSLLFRNILDIKNIENQFGGLTDYQVEVIKKFWLNFNYEKPTGQKTGFLSIWSVLEKLYYGFHSELRRKNLAYEGMIFREFAETSAQGFRDEKFDLVHFIGFNALNECEKKLMTRYRTAGQARFYWDYDNSYITGSQTNSAGHFLRENLKYFGNDMPADWSYNTFLSTDSPEIKRQVIETSSDVAQVKLISGIVEEIPGISEENAHHTAIVLADENLLMPVLTSLPDSLGEINITMGYPLKQTPVYTFIRHLMDLQRNTSVSAGLLTFNYSDVISVIKHSLLSGILKSEEKALPGEIVKNNYAKVPQDLFSKSELFSLIFQKPYSPSKLSDYFKDILSYIAVSKPDEEMKAGFMEKNIRNEFIYRVVLSLNRLEIIVNDSEIALSVETYLKIFDRLLRMQSVPFSGEPLKGIQIMGILETRALDFKNLIILSVNEGILPTVSSGSSFIPFSLREAFGLPSVNHQESIYAYHFYRLLQRSENVTLVYNSNTEGLRSGEMSRFIIQMKYDKILKPVFLDLNYSIDTNLTQSEILKRKAEHTDVLTSMYVNNPSGRPLSPSAINTWLNCRMKFYYRYINNLKETEDVSEAIDPAMLGTVLHEVMKVLYLPYTGRVLSNVDIDNMLTNKQLLAEIIQKTLTLMFRSGRDEISGGNELIVREVLQAYLEKVLAFDKLTAPVTILNLEESFNFELTVNLRGSSGKISAGGKVDRVDRVADLIRIVDYKTGTVSESLNSVNDLFVEDRKKDADGWLQTLLYCEAYSVKNPGSKLRPSVYRIKNMNDNEYSDRLKIKSIIDDPEINDYAVIRDQFLEGLTEVVNKIFSDDEPFIKTKDLRAKCSFCPYRILCGR